MAQATLAANKTYAYQEKFKFTDLKLHTSRFQTDENFYTILLPFLRECINKVVPQQTMLHIHRIAKYYPTGGQRLEFYEMGKAFRDLHASATPNSTVVSEALSSLKHAVLFITSVFLTYEFPEKDMSRFGAFLELENKRAYFRDKVAKLVQQCDHYTEQPETDKFRLAIHALHDLMRLELSKVGKVAYMERIQYLPEVWSHLERIGRSDLDIMVADISTQPYSARRVAHKVITPKGESHCQHVYLFVTDPKYMTNVLLANDDLNKLISLWLVKSDEVTSAAGKEPPNIDILLESIEKEELAGAHAFDMNRCFEDDEDDGLWFDEEAGVDGNASSDEESSQSADDNGTQSSASSEERPRKRLRKRCEEDDDEEQPEEDEDDRALKDWAQEKKRPQQKRRIDASQSSVEIVEEPKVEALKEREEDEGEDDDVELVSIEKLAAISRCGGKVKGSEAQQVEEAQTSRADVRARTILEAQTRERKSGQYLSRHNAQRIVERCIELYLVGASVHLIFTHFAFITLVYAKDPRQLKLEDIRNPAYSFEERAKAHPQASADKPKSVKKAPVSGSLDRMLVKKAPPNDPTRDMDKPVNTTTKTKTMPPKLPSIQKRVDSVLIKKAPPNDPSRDITKPLQKPVKVIATPPKAPSIQTRVDPHLKPVEPVAPNSERAASVEQVKKPKCSFGLIRK